MNADKIHLLDFVATIYMVSGVKPAENAAGVGFIALVLFKKFM